MNQKFLVELALVLIDIAKGRDLVTYGQLSDRFEPMLTYRMAPQAWARPLGELSLVCIEHGLPAISALVINRDMQMPGEGFFTFVGELRGWQSISPSKWESVWLGELKLVYNCTGWNALIEALKTSKAGN